MAGLGLGAGFGAGAAGATLGDILKQKFLEQMQRQKLAEDMRQADMQNQIQRGNLDLGQQRIGLDTQKLGEDTRQFDVTSGQNAKRIGFEGEDLALKKAAEPSRIAHVVAQTEDLNRQPQEAIDTRTYQTGRDKTLQGYEQQNIGARTAGALRVADRERADDWQIVDTPTGGKVRVNRLTGEEQPLQQAGKSGTGGRGAVSEQYANERQRRITHSVDQMMGQADWTTVGPAAWASGVPGSPALAFRKKIDTLNANIAFGELAEMRAASKTGGALGQVSDKEGNLLQATLGALDQKMSPDQFKSALTEIKGTLARWNAAKAAEAASKNATGGLGVTTGAGNDSAAKAAALIKKYGGG